jgi:transcription initiation factor IIE alpha subunit
VQNISSPLLAHRRGALNYMTNKKLISYECERLENIRQEVIIYIETNLGLPAHDIVREIGEIIYELTEKIKDEKT